MLQDVEGRILEEFAFQNNPHGHEELVAHLKAYPETQAAIESTGNLWIPIYNRIGEEHINVTLNTMLKSYANTAVAEARW